jgi:transcriptional regulator with XRE-family HTH domain
VANAKGDSQQQATNVGPARSSRKRAAGREGANPIVSQRELGLRLRALRNARRLTLVEVARQTGWSPSKISRLETGDRGADLNDVRELCAIYGVTDEGRVDEIVALTSEAHEQAWWSPYESVLRRYMGLEHRASVITAYSMYFVPALLQTGDYARATIKSIERKIDPTVLDQRVEARLRRRQELFARENPPRYRALVDEAALRRQVGGAEVMGMQLSKILELAAEEKAIVQVIPFDAGAHASTDSNFALLEFGSDTRQSAVVFVEGLFSNRFLKRAVEINRYREAIEYLRDAALSVRDSLNLITEIKRLHESQ